MKTIFIDTILHDTFDVNNINESIMCVTSTHTHKRTRHQWKEKFAIYCKKAKINTTKLKIRFYKGPTFRPLIGFSITLPLFIIIKQPHNLIINRYDNANAFVIYSLTRLFSPKTKIHFYSEMWMMPKTPIYALFQPLIKWLIVRCDKHWVLGSPQKKFLIKNNVPEKKICITHDVAYAPILPAVDLLQQCKNKIASKQTINLLYAGRIIAYKGLLSLLIEYKDLINQYPGAFFLTIVGGGKEHNESQYSGEDSTYEKRCRYFAKQYLPDNSYIFTGYKPIITPYLEQADLTLTPNRIIIHDLVPAEAWGRVPIESIQHNTPVLATTSIASAHDLIVNDVNGWIVPKFTFAPLINLYENTQKQVHNTHRTREHAV